MAECREEVKSEVEKVRERDRNSKMFKWLHEVGAQLELEPEHRFLSISEADEYRLSTRLAQALYVRE